MHIIIYRYLRCMMMKEVVLDQLRLTQALFPLPSEYCTCKTVTARFWPRLSGGEGYHESRRCSRETYPESCITKYTSIRRNK